MSILGLWNRSSALRFRPGRRWRFVLLALFTALSTAIGAEPFDLISQPDPSQGPPASGGGDSVAPILTPDGRFVLFASTARNLVMAPTNAPPPAPYSGCLDVFVRDRSNQTTALVSVNLSGAGGGNASSFPAAISSDGRYALFESASSDLVSGDTNNATDIFLRDLVQGTTILVSVSTNGGCGNGSSAGSVMTSDGRYAAFASAANNLVLGDTNGIADVYLRDTLLGVTKLVSVGARAATLPPNSGLASSGSEAPEITPDGQYVTFFSTATNLVPGVSSVGDIYLRDVVAGTTIWASSGARAAVLAATGGTNAVSFSHCVSSNGQVVAYEAKPVLTSGYSTTGLILRHSVQSGLTDVISTNAPAPTSAFEDARNLSLSPNGRFVAFLANAGPGSGGATIAGVWDANSGLTVVASRDLSNNVPSSGTCDWPLIDAEGRYVAFTSSTTNLVTNALVGEYHLYLRELQAGTTALIDADTNGLGTGVDVGVVPTFSADWRRVAFEAADSGLVANDRNRGIDVFLRDLDTSSTELISARASTLGSASPNGASQLSSLSVSSDGRYVAFASDANNLVPGDTNGCLDIFVRDLLLGSNMLVSVGTNGVWADAPSSEPAISGNGRYVVFTSSADNLVPGDTNKASDVFVRDVLNGTTTLVSVNTNGSGAGNKLSYAPAISPDGRFVLFRSQALDIAAPSLVLGYENLFVRDLVLGTNYALTRTTTGAPVGALSPGGRYIAYYGQRGFYGAMIHLWDNQVANVIYSGDSVTSVVSLLASPDGNRIAYVSSLGPTLYILTRSPSSSVMITNSISTSRNWLRFSGDGRLLAYVARVPAPATNRVYVYDCVAGTNFLVSQSYNPLVPADSFADSPEVSSDGRFVAYRSAAGNLVPGDTNGLPDVFVYDRQSGTTTLLSANRFGTAAADDRSLAPAFSGDSQTLFFQSWGSDLVGQDFNHAADILSYHLFSSADIPLFAAAAASGAGAATPWILWPVVAGKTYRVEFKDSLSDPEWHNLNGGVMILGTQGSFSDTGVGPGTRFYRVVGY